MENRDRVASTNQLRTRAQKEAHGQQWYKEELDKLDTEDNTSFNGDSEGNQISEYQRMKVNYDLYNNILNVADFEYVCSPFGAEAGELPANMVNRDISSGRIKAMLGMEMKRPFSWKVIATNKDATTKKEQEEFGRIQEYVIAQIMSPIRQRIEAEAAEKVKGKKLTEQEREQIAAEIAKELHHQTPDKVKQYMERDYQDPAEVLSHQILEYLIQEQKLKRKFNKGFEHMLLGAKQFYRLSIINKKPTCTVVNAIRVNYDKSPDLEFIEDGESASVEYRVNPSDVISQFHTELTNKEINDIYNEYSHYAQNEYADRLFDFSRDNVDVDNEQATVRVFHGTWKALRQMGFLTYIDQETGTVEEIIVDENYKIDHDNGDIQLDWEWIPEVYEGYKIGADIYVGMQPVPGQFKDMDNLYSSKLPYYGAICDNLNSIPTSLMDRMKVYQYYNNIVMYRLELLLASDKGKKILMNINAIPESAGMDIEKWQYFFESTPFMWFNPDEEGNTGYNDVNTMAKEIDMSLASDIGKYIEFSEYLNRKCGESVGLTDTVMGQISPSAEVGNTKQEIQQTGHVLEPYFDLQTQVKGNVLEGLINLAKVAYSENPPEAVNYFLDDMSRKTLTVDTGLLDNSTLGIFVANSAKSHETKELIRQLAHAAMQNQKAELSDVLAVIRQDGTQEAEEVLVVAEKDRKAELNEQAKLERDARAKEGQAQRDFAKELQEEKHQDTMEEITLKGEIDLQKQAMLSMGFNEDKDMDSDGVPDVLEVLKNGADANIKSRKQKLDEDKHVEDKKQNKITNKQKDRELQIKEKQSKQKATTS